MSVFGIDIERGAVRIFKNGVSKHDALDRLVDAIADTGAVADREMFHRAVHEREAIMSTGIGSGVAIPHVRITGILKPAVGVGISHEGIAFDTLDNKPVNILVLFAMPSGSQKEYLGLLAQVMLALRTPGLRERLTACNNVDDVLTALEDS